MTTLLNGLVPAHVVRGSFAGHGNLATTQVYAATVARAIGGAAVGALERAYQGAVRERVQPADVASAPAPTTGRRQRPTRVGGADPGASPPREGAGGVVVTTRKRPRSTLRKGDAASAGFVAISLTYRAWTRNGENRFRREERRGVMAEDVPGRARRDICRR